MLTDSQPYPVHNCHFITVIPSLSFHNCHCITVIPITAPHLVRVIGALHHLGVFCEAHAHLFVSGVGRLAAAVAHGGLHHAWHALEGQLKAPEAAAGRRRWNKRSGRLGIGGLNNLIKPY
jgi:hypothetical protein